MLGQRRGLPQGADPSDLLYAINPGAGLTIEVTGINQNAGYHNSLGYYFADAGGNPISGAILSDWAGNPSGENAILTIPTGSVPVGAAVLGFFLCPTEIRSIRIWRMATRSPSNL